MTTFQSLVYLEQINLSPDNKLVCIGTLHNSDNVIFINEKSEYFVHPLKSSDSRQGEFKKLIIDPSFKVSINSERDELVINGKSFLGSRKIKYDYHFLEGITTKDPDDPDILIIDKALSERLPPEFCLPECATKLNIKSISNMFHDTFNKDRFPNDLQPFIHIINASNKTDEEFIHSIRERSKFMMCVEPLRLLTFGNWPHNFPFTKPRNLALSGFYDSFCFDRVNCFNCNTTLTSWEESDEPLTEHRRHFNQCKFISIDKGPKYSWNVSQTDFSLHRPFRQIEEEIRLIGQVEGSKLFLPTVDHNEIISIWDVSSVIRLAMEIDIRPFVPSKDFKIKQLKLTCLRSSYECVTLNDDDQFNHREMINPDGFPYLLTTLVQTKKGFLLLLSFRVNLNSTSNCLYLMNKTKVSYYDIMKYHLRRETLEKFVNMHTSSSIFSDTFLENAFDVVENMPNEELAEKTPSIGQSIMSDDNVVLKMILGEYINGSGDEVDFYTKHFVDHESDSDNECTRTSVKETFEEDISEMYIIITSYGNENLSLSNGFIKLYTLSTDLLGCQVFCLKFPLDITIKQLEYIETNLTQVNVTSFLGIIDQRLVKIDIYKEDETFSYAIFNAIHKQDNAHPDSFIQTRNNDKLIISNKECFSIYKWIPGLQSDYIFRSYMDLKTDTYPGQDQLKSYSQESKRKGSIGRDVARFDNFVAFLPRIFHTSPLNQYQWTCQASTPNSELTEKLELITPRDENSVYKGSINQLSKLIATQSLPLSELMRFAYKAYSFGSRLWDITDYRLEGARSEDLFFPIKVKDESIPLSRILLHLHLRNNRNLLPKHRVKVDLLVSISPENDKSIQYTQSIIPYSHHGKKVSFYIENELLHKIIPGKVINLKLSFTSQDDRECFKYVQIEVDCFSGFLRNRNKYLCNQEMFLLTSMRYNETFARINRQDVYSSFGMQKQIFNLLFNHDHALYHHNYMQIVASILHNLSANHNVEPFQEFLTYIATRLDDFINLFLINTRKVSLLEDVSNLLKTMISVDHRYSLLEGIEARSAFFNSFRQNYLDIYTLPTFDMLLKKMHNTKSIEVLFQSIIFFVSLNKDSLDSRYIEKYIQLLKFTLASDHEKQSVPALMHKFDLYPDYFTSDASEGADQDASTRPLPINYQVASVSLRSTCRIVKDGTSESYYLNTRKLTPGRIFDVYIPVGLGFKLNRIVLRREPNIVAIAIQLRFNQNKDHFLDIMLSDEREEFYTLDITDWPYFDEAIFCGIHLVVAVRMENLSNDFNMHLGEYYGSINEDVDSCETIPLPDATQLEHRRKAIYHCFNQFFIELFMDPCPEVMTPHISSIEGLISVFHKMAMQDEKKLLSQSILLLSEKMLSQSIESWTPFLALSINDSILTDLVLRPILADYLCIHTNHLPGFIRQCLSFVRQNGNKDLAKLSTIFKTYQKDLWHFIPRDIHQSIVADAATQENFLVILQNLVTCLNENKSDSAMECGHVLDLCLNMKSFMADDTFDKLPLPNLAAVKAHPDIFSIFFQHSSMIKHSDLPSTDATINKEVIEAVHKLEKAIKTWLDKSMSALLPQFSSLSDYLDALSQIYSNSFHRHLSERSPEENAETLLILLEKFNQSEYISDHYLNIFLSYMSSILGTLKGHHFSAQLQTIYSACLKSIFQRTNFTARERDGERVFEEYVAIVEAFFGNIHQEEMSQFILDLFEYDVNPGKSLLIRLLIFKYTQKLILGEVIVPNVKPCSFSNKLKRYLSDPREIDLIYDLDLTEIPIHSSLATLKEIMLHHGNMIEIMCYLIILHSRLNSTDILTDPEATSHLRTFFISILNRVPLTDAFLQRFMHDYLKGEGEKVHLISEMTRGDISLRVIDVFEACLLKLNVLEECPLKADNLLNLFLIYKYREQVCLADEKYDYLVQNLNSFRKREQLLHVLNLEEARNITKYATLQRDDSIDTKEPSKKKQIHMQLSKLFMISEVKITTNANVISESLEVNFFRYNRQETRRSSLCVPVDVSAYYKSINYATRLDYSRHLPLADELRISWSSQNLDKESVTQISVYGSSMDDADVEKALQMEQSRDTQKNKMTLFTLALLSGLKKEKVEKYSGVISRFYLEEVPQCPMITWVIIDYLSKGFTLGHEKIRQTLMNSNRDYFSHLVIAAICKFVLSLASMISDAAKVQIMEQLVGGHSQLNPSTAIQKISSPFGLFRSYTKNKFNSAAQVLARLEKLSNATSQVYPIVEDNLHLLSEDLKHKLLLSSDKHHLLSNAILKSTLTNLDSLLELESLIDHHIKEHGHMGKSSDMVLLNVGRFQCSSLQQAVFYLEQNPSTIMKWITKSDLESPQNKVFLSSLLPVLLANRMICQLLFTQLKDEFMAHVSSRVSLGQTFILAIFVGIDANRFSLPSEYFEEFEDLVLKQFILPTISTSAAKDRASRDWYALLTLRLISRTRSLKTQGTILNFVSSHLGQENSQFLFDLIKDLRPGKRINFKIYLNTDHEKVSSPIHFESHPSVESGADDKSDLNILSLKTLIVISQSVDFDKLDMGLRKLPFLRNPDLINRKLDAGHLKQILGIYRKYKEPTDLLHHILEFNQDKIQSCYIEASHVPSIWSNDNATFDSIYSILAKELISKRVHSLAGSLSQHQNYLSIFSLVSFIFFIQSERYISLVKASYPDFCHVYFEAFVQLLKETMDLETTGDRKPFQISEILDTVSANLSGSRGNILAIPFVTFCKMASLKDLTPSEKELIGQSSLFIMALVNVIELKRRYLKQTAQGTHLSECYLYTQMCEDVVARIMERLIEQESVNNLDHHQTNCFSKGTGYSLAGLYDSNQNEETFMEISRRNLVLNVSLRALTCSIHHTKVALHVPRELVAEQFVGPFIKIIMPILLSDSIKEITSKRRQYLHILNILKMLITTNEFAHLLFAQPDDVIGNVEEFLERKSLSLAYEKYLERNKMSIAAIIGRFSKFVKDYIDTERRIIASMNENMVEPEYFSNPSIIKPGRKCFLRQKSIRNRLKRAEPTSNDNDKESGDVKFFGPEEINQALLHTSSKGKKNSQRKNSYSFKTDDREEGTLEPLVSVDAELDNLMGLLKSAFEGFVRLKENNEATEETADDEDSLSSRYLQLLKPLQSGEVQFLQPIKSKPNTYGPLIFHNFSRESLKQDGLKFEDLLHRSSTGFTPDSEHVPKKNNIMRLAREQHTLSSNLPLSWETSIFFRYDESRRNLMKALIIGPPDTPYSNGCFEFDIFTDSSYPSNPPKCLFVTTGGGSIRFNPNLYENGKVCLSLLNTWQSTPEERWNPTSSTLLQILISIQSMIFVEKPYFNEPGYQMNQGTPAGESVSKGYNEAIEIGTLKWAILDQIENPPKAFEEVVKIHFQLKKDEIIKDVQKWIDNSKNQSHRNILTGYLDKFKNLNL